MVQWPGLPAPNAGGLSLIPGQGTRSCMLQLRPGEAEINTYRKKKKTKHHNKVGEDNFQFLVSFCNRALRALGM